MPRTFKLTSEARESLLKDAQTWRESFTAIARSKDPAAAVAKPLVGLVDGVCSSVNHALEQVEGLQIHNAKLSEGLDKAMNVATAALADLGEQQKRMVALEEDYDKTRKLANNNERRCNRALNFVQRIQLEHSSTVLVIRGIEQKNRRESYFELEDLFQQIMRSIRLDNIIPTYVRRLPQMGNNRRDPPAIKANLASLGDKIRIYHAFEKAVKEHKVLPFSVTNEIPQYALGSYKHHMKVAAEVRAMNPGVKTRVGIARNAIWPSITVRGKNDTKYVKIDDAVFTDARNRVLLKQKKISEQKREKREEEELLEQGLEEMAVDTSNQPNTRPSRQAKQTEKIYK